MLLREDVGLIKQVLFKRKPLHLLPDPQIHDDDTEVGKTLLVGFSMWLSQRTEMAAGMGGPVDPGSAAGLRCISSPVRSSITGPLKIIDAMI